MLTTSNLTVTYNKKVKALKNINVTIADGVITGLIGPSGGGKSTLIKTIVGALAPTSGDVLVGNIPAGSHTLRGQIAYMSQSLSIYSDLTVKQNLEYFAKMLNSDIGQIDNILATVDLTEKARVVAEDLSGGQKQRVSLAIALLGDPSVLVLDEPTVGLDPVLVDDLWKLFHKLADEQGKTLIISSHSMTEAARSEQLLLMSAGQVIFQGTPKTLLKSTKTKTIEQAFLKIEREGEQKS